MIKAYLKRFLEKFLILLILYTAYQVWPARHNNSFIKMYFLRKKFLV